MTKPLPILARFLSLSLIAVMTVLATACDESLSGPSSLQNLSISTPTPAPGSSITVTQNGSHYFLARGSGLFSVPIKVTSNREVPYAQLSVYLYDGSEGAGYCGQNIPDAPTWGPFKKGWTVNVSITGFQISHVPCNVTSIRAWLHTRNNGLLIPPSENETVATGTLPVSYTFRQQQ